MPKPIYYSIDSIAARANPSYWNLTKHMFYEQAARILQRWWRAKKEIQYKDKNKNPETLNSSLSLRFLKEPLDSKAIEYAQQIKAGEWCNLHFNDDEFARNIYKAGRLGLISINELATAILLYEATIEFKETEVSRKEFPTLKQHRFEENPSKTPPFTMDKISYALEKNKDDFMHWLKELPMSEQWYFTINLSKKREIAFIYDGLKDELYLTDSKFLNIVDNYLSRGGGISLLKRESIACLEIIKDQLKKINSTESPLESKEESVEASIQLNKKKILQYILLKEKNFKNSLQNEINNLVEDKDKQSSMLLISLLKLNEQLPSYTISPDFNKENPNSPLLCIILPTMEAFIHLQLAVHGDSTTNPFFNAGQIDSRMIRYLDETPEAFGLKIQARAVELIHPDLKPTEKQHNYVSHAFTASWHDLLHCWRNGTNSYKPFTRYLRQLLTTEKGFDMSKSLWTLSDMDYSTGRRILESGKNNKSYYGYLVRFISILLADAGRDNQRHFLLSGLNDDNLLLLINMIQENKKWTYLTGIENIEFLILRIYEINMRLNFHTVPLLDIKNEISSIKKIIQENPGQSNKFYILAYRLKHHTHGNIICQLLQKHINLNNILQWNRNSGLYIKKDYSASTNRTIEKIDPVDLFDQLSSIIKMDQIQNKNNYTPEETNDIEEFIPKNRKRKMNCFFDEMNQYRNHTNTDTLPMNDPSPPRKKISNSVK